jgi:FixJ family two-component response regulator
MQRDGTVAPSPGQSVGSIVYVIDDDESVRFALGMLLRSTGVRAEVFEGQQQFLDFPKPDIPSCVLLDVRLHGESGLIVHEELVRHGLHMPVIFITGHGDISMSVKAMKAGALDFISKPFREQDILDAVSNAIKHDTGRRSSARQLAELRKNYEDLTPREREVVALVAAGYMNKQIASSMDISEITVKIHRGQAMKKMRSKSVADLVRKAEMLGLNESLKLDDEPRE